MFTLTQKMKMVLTQQIVDVLMLGVFPSTFGHEALFKEKSVFLSTCYYDVYKGVGL